jgi:hypothetical protein
VKKIRRWAKGTVKKEEEGSWKWCTYTVHVQYADVKWDGEEAKRKRIVKKNMRLGLIMGKEGNLKNVIC